MIFIPSSGHSRGNEGQRGIDGISRGLAEPKRISIRFDKKSTAFTVDGPPREDRNRPGWERHRVPPPAVRHPVF